MSSLRMLTSLLLITHLTAPGALAGTRLETGDKVRITVAAPELGDRFEGLPTPGEKVEGMFVDVEDGDLLLRLGSGARVRVPRAAVARLEVSEGRSSNAGKGAVIGVGVGLGLAVVLAGSAERADPFLDTFHLGGVYAAPLVAIGALTGLVLGAASKSEVWTVVESPRVKLALAPQPGGVGVRLRF